MTSSIKNVTAGIPPIVDNLNSTDADKTLSAKQGSIINQRLIEVFNQPDMVIMTQAELSNYSDDPKFVYYDQSTQTFKQKSGTARSLIAGDWTLIKSIETLTSHLEFPETYHRAKIETDRHFQIPLGDQGGGEPYGIIVKGSDGVISFETDKDFRSLSNLSLEQQRGIKNRGHNNIIDWNNIRIFSGFPKHIFFPVELNNPYILPENGSWYNGLPDPGINDGENCFKDLWLFWGGIESLEIGPIFNPLDSDSGLWKKVAMDSTGGRFIRPVTINGSTVDPNPHTRLHPPHLGAVSTIPSYNSSGTDEISGISDTNIKRVKVGCRVIDAGHGIPWHGGTPKTTLIARIIHNSTDNNSIFLIDSESRLPVNVTATGDLTVDWGGNTGVSHQDDTVQGHKHDSWSTFGMLPAGATGGYNGTGWYFDNGGHRIRQVTSPVTDGTNGNPRTGPQTMPINVSRYSAWSM